MITAEQREARRHSIGSSDAPAIVGVCPFGSPFTVFMSKVYDVEDLPNKGPIASGNRWEGAILDWAQEELGVELERNISVRHPTDLICAANLDARVKGKPIGVEAKFTGMGHEFGEAGTDEIPERVIVQAHHQMYVDSLELVYVPVLLARFGRIQETMFTVKRNDDLIAAIVEREHAFWAEHVVPKIPPPLGGPASLEVLKRVKRVPGKTVDVDAALVSAWQATREIRLDAEKTEKAALAAVLAELGDAEAGDYGDAETWLTYFSSPRAGYVVAPTTVRTARIAKRK